MKSAKKIRSAPLLSYLGWMALPLVLSKAQIGGLYAPWALAAVAVAGEDLRGLCAVIGAVAGGWLFLPFQEGLRHAACAVLIYAVTLTFTDSSLYLKPWFRPLSAAITLLLVQSVALIGFRFPHWMLCMAAAAIAAIAVYRSTTGNADTRTIWLILGFCAALRPLELGHFSPGIVCGGWLVLLLSGNVAGSAAAVGAGIGMMLDLVPEKPVLLLAVGFALGAYLAAQWEKRVLRAGGFCLGVLAVALLFDADYITALLFESLTAAVAYLCIPSRFLPSREASSLSESANVSLRQGAAFHELYESLFRQEQPESSENPAVLFDRAAEQICQSCTLQGICWQKEYQDTYDAFNNACPHLLRRGTAAADDFPIHFASRCIHFPALIQAINRELYAYLLRQQYRLQLQDVKELAAAQYQQIGELLDGQDEIPAAAIGSKIVLQCASALRPKDSECLCGDQIARFSFGVTDYFLLCDGMGSGNAAHAEAAMTVRLLGQFLSAGIDPLPALKTLNTAMLLRRDENGAFPAVDLLAIRRDTGHAVLYKYGAAASYVKHYGQVSRYTSKSLPVGLQQADQPPETQLLRLHQGDIIALVSDGVVAEGDEWLQDLLAGFSGEIDTLVQQILQKSQQYGGEADDCAVVAVLVRNIPTRHV